MAEVSQTESGASDPEIEKKIHLLVGRVSQDLPGAPEDEIRKRVVFLINNNCIEHAGIFSLVPVDRMADLLAGLRSAKPETAPEAEQADRQKAIQEAAQGAVLYPEMIKPPVLFNADGYPTMKAEPPKSMYPSMSQK